MSIDVILDIQNIDSLITLWRGRKAAAITNGDKQDELISGCYVDAYQTVRVNNGLSILPFPEISKNDYPKQIE